MKDLDKKTVGTISLILGGIFFLAGLVLFVLTNSVNLYAKKANATILARYEVDSDEPYTMLEVCYRVGDELVTTMDSFYEDIPEEVIDKVIYYDIRNPKKLVDGGWNFFPLATALLGVFIAFPGLYYKDILTFGIEPRKKPGKKATKWEIDFYETGERLENDIIPFAGAVCMLVFGIVMKIVQKGWWQWILIGLGAMACVYVLMDMIPVLTKYVSLKKIKKINKKAVTVDDDFEKFNKKKKEKEILEAMNEEGIEIEETYEIKKTKINKKKRK